MTQKNTNIYKFYINPMPTKTFYFHFLRGVNCGIQGVAE